VRARVGAEELVGELVELTIAGGIRLRTPDGGERRVPLELAGLLVPL
jgi:hypothetical protein